MCLKVILIQNLIFVTNDDEVYVFGENREGVLATGNQRKVQKVTKVNELSNKRTEKFSSK